MQAHELRVVDEKKELDIKILALFMFTTMSIYANLSEQEKTLLQRQHTAMRQYSEVLGERIKLFTK